jgi:ribosome-associated protein
LKLQQKLINISNEELNQVIIDCIQDKKGHRVMLLDLRNLEERPTDYFIICEGTSTTQVKAIADYVSEEVKKRTAVYAAHIEGTKNALWVLLDYLNTVVHIFDAETREFYQLEELWGDAKVIEYKEL